MNTTRPPGWVGTPEVQELLARAISAELREQARLLRTEYADIMLVHRSAGIGAAEQLERRADELERGNR